MQGKELMRAARRARLGVEQQAAQAEDLFGDRLDVSAADICWALGNVLSRCLSSLFFAPPRPLVGDVQCNSVCAMESNNVHNPHLSHQTLESTGSCRCYGSDEGLALLPGIDLFNHSPRAATPREWVATDSHGQEVPACALLAEYDGAAAAVAAGEEFFVSYSMAKTTLQDAFLTFGFVPSELLPRRTG